MNAHANARPYGLALGFFMSASCVLPSPLGELDTETDGSSGSGSSSTSAGDPSGDTTGGASDTSIDPGPPPVGPAAIDILFVLDNSGSMGEEQGALAASIDSMVTALEQVGGVSYRIGVTTTDDGNSWCYSTSPEAGALELSSCRQRTGEFVFNGVEPIDATELACTNVCALEEIPLLATTTHVDGTPSIRPWIEVGPGGTNLDGVGVGDALRCSMPQGLAGCGFESPLESAKKAILRSNDPGDAQFGFIRPDAHLAIVIVTDETDCSSEAPWSVFADASHGGNPEVFWSDPLSSSPTSAVCWRAGVECTGGPGTYEECHAANRNLSGEFGVPDEAAVLKPLDEYRTFFAELLADKRATADASVFMFGVVGVPPGYPANPLVFADSSDPSAQSDFGIGFGCSSEFGNAVPSVRERELIESFHFEGMTSTVYSICQPPLADVYSRMIGQLAPFLGGG